VVPWVRASKTDILNNAITKTVSGRITYVEGSWFKIEDQKWCIGIPDGEVAVALGYPDGSLSQFVALSFKGIASQGEEENDILGGILAGPPRATSLQTCPSTGTGEK